MAKSKTKLKRRKKIRKKKIILVDKGWDGRGGYSKTGHDGIVYYLDRLHRVRKISRPGAPNWTEPDFPDQDNKGIPDTWLFKCPLDENIQLAIDNLPEDTPRHCEDCKLMNNQCPFLDEGCTGCDVEAQKRLNRMINQRID